MEQLCDKCEIIKSNNQFRIYKNGSVRYICKKCDNEYDKERKKQNRQNKLETYKKDCELCKKTKVLKEFAKLKKNYKKNICLECYPVFLTEQKTEWCRNERERNPNYRLKKSLAARLRNVMNKGDNTTLDYIGCNMDFLRKWFEYNFTEDMCWENYGEYWSIDHIIPVNKFDLTQSKEKFECWNWTNLVPLKCSYNSSKKNTIDITQIQKVKIKLTNFLKEKGSTTKWFSVEKCIIMSNIYSA